MGPKKKKKAKSKSGPSTRTPTSRSSKKSKVSKEDFVNLIANLEMEKEFDEIKIAELEKQVGRLRVHTAELETNLDDAMNSFKKLDEDRADIIAYLKRTVQHKIDEIAELNERNTALKKSTDATIFQLHEQIEEMRVESKHTNDRMLAEIKLLTGKLGSLEEFRAAREDLYNKFALQEETMVQQDHNYKQLISSLQKEHMLSKNKLRKEMEDKLVQLSTDFHKTTQNRIAATTQNLIRENIGINNELFVLIGSWQIVHQENEDLKTQLKQVSLDNGLTKEQLDETLLSNISLREIIDKLLIENNRITTYADEYIQNQSKIKELERLMDQIELERNQAVEQSQRLQQEKEMLVVKTKELAVNFNKVQCHNSKLERIIHKATLVVKDAIGLEKAKFSGQFLDEAEFHAKKQSLLSALLDILNEDFVIISIPPEGDASVPTITSDMRLEDTSIILVR